MKITTNIIEKSIPEGISDEKLIKLYKLAYKHLQPQEQKLLLNLSGLPNLDLNTRIICRLIRISYKNSSIKSKVMLTALLEKGVDAFIFQSSNLLSYEHPTHFA